MHAITVFSAVGGNGYGPSGRSLRPVVTSFLWCLIFLIPASPSAAKAIGQPMAGGDSSGILPVSLGKPKGCVYSNAYALNSGIYPEDLVVAGSMQCGSDNGFPYQWRQGVWTPLELPEGGIMGGYAMSVDDNPGGPASVSYHLWDGAGITNVYVLTDGMPPYKLDLLPDTVGSERSRLTAQGDHVVGDNFSGDWDSGYSYRAVRWAREATGWSAPEELAPGRAVAASEDGGIVVGNTDPYAWFRDGDPWVWTSTPEGGEVALLDASAVVYDITHDGAMIVGSRPQACSDTVKCDFFPAPVYWVKEEDAWVMHDLQALDGVDSIAESVAIVKGSAIIAGRGYTPQEGGILRPVVWISDGDGSYGPPLRLESIGGDFNSWAEATDINRNGLVLGWSDIEPGGGYSNVIWSLFEEMPFQINGGISDVWYSPATDGQGFFVNVWEDLRTVFVGWFTYDTERPDASAILGDPGHRWLTAQGSYADDTAVLGITMTGGGIFDSGSPAPTRSPDGTMTLEFSNCTSGTVTFDIPSIGRQGVIPIERVSSANIANCERLAMPSN
jgi:uncharacterized membrane protein